MGLHGLRRERVNGSSPALVVVNPLRPATQFRALADGILAKQPNRMQPVTHVGHLRLRVVPPHACSARCKP